MMIVMMRQQDELEELEIYYRLYYDTDEEPLTGVHCLRVNFSLKHWPSNIIRDVKNLKFQRSRGNLNYQRYARIVTAIRQNHPDVYHHMPDHLPHMIPELTVVMRHWRFLYDAYIHDLPFPASNWHNPLDIIVRSPTDYKPRKPHTPATLFSSPRWCLQEWWAPGKSYPPVVQDVQAHLSWLDFTWCTKCARPIQAARFVPVKPPSAEYLRVFYPYLSV
eukprot:jgi/Chlat1/7326/Chrsp58S06927